MIWPGFLVWIAPHTGQSHLWGLDTGGNKRSLKSLHISRAAEHSAALLLLAGSLLGSGARAIGAPIHHSVTILTLN